MDSAANTLGIGDTFEHGTLRVHRYADTLKLWDVTHAGKARKKVRYAYTSPEYSRSVSAQERSELLEKMARALTTHSSFDTALEFLRGLQREYPALIGIAEGVYRGVDVPPAGFTVTEMTGKRVRVHLDYDSFLVACTVDTANEPRICNVGGKENVAKFAEWFKQNRKSLATMDLRGVETSLAANGIAYHHWYGMD